MYIISSTRYGDTFRIGKKGNSYTPFLVAYLNIYITYAIEYHNMNGTFPILLFQKNIHI